MRFEGLEGRQLLSTFKWENMGSNDGFHLIQGGTADQAQPLLAPTYYISRALGPYAEIREGKGGKVKSRKQAIAIGLSQARESGAKVPKKKGGGRSRSKKKSS